MCRFLWFAMFCRLRGLVGVGLHGCVGILVVLTGVRRGRRLVLGGRGRFRLCVFGIRLCGTGLGPLFVRRAVRRLWLSFLLLLDL